jgi:hypothetical protein
LLLLTISGGFAGATYAGNQMNHITLSPHYAGTLFGITNAAANVCGFLAPYAVGLLINGNVSIYAKKNEIGGACGMYGRQEIYTQGLVEIPEGKRPLGKPRHRWEDNIKVGLQEEG